MSSLTIRVSSEEAAIIRHALDSLLVSLRIERAIAPVDNVKGVEAFGIACRQLSDRLAKENAFTQACDACDGSGWVAAYDPQRPMTTYAKKPCPKCSAT
jgi:excinuclease UvrABC ATPase subunit